MVQKNNLDKILIICGPTSSSKTALAVECAKRLNSEVVSADSLYIYKDLNIGTAKPSEEEMQGVKHHLIDTVESVDSFTVSQYKEYAESIIQNLIKNGKIPVICGGTGFYINSILFDLSYGNGEANLVVREKYKTLAEKFGNEYVYNILLEKDSESANKIHKNDVKRVIRALEIYETGIKKSDIKDDYVAKYNYKAFSVDYQREELYDRINKRVDIMLNNGLIDEVKSLIKKGITIKNQCMQGIGYKEVYDYLNGKLTLEQTIDLIKLNTRHYAKRQITFFKRLDNLQLIKPNSVEKMADYIMENL